MRYQKIKKNLIRLSVFTLLIHSEVVFSTETIEGKKNHTLEKQTYNEGIDIKGQSTVENKGDLSVSSHHPNRPAVKVSEGSILKLRGTQDKLTTITTSGKNSPGLLASGSGTEVTADNIDMTTKSENSDVVKAEAGATIHIQESTIKGKGGYHNGFLFSYGENTHLTGHHLTIKGKGKDGVFVRAQNGARLSLYNSTISSEGDSFYGLWIEGKKSNFMGHHIKIEAKGNNVIGVLAQNGATLMIEDSSINGAGDYFVGLWAYGEKSNLTGHQIKIGAEGNNLTGVLAQNGATLTGHQMEIKINGQKSSGMMALSGASLSVHDSTMTTQGNATGFQGFYAEGENTTISADKMNIITEGKDSYGVRALKGATLHIKGSTIITRGASSPALWSKASTLKISDSYLKTTETDSAILHVAAENTKKRKSLVEITKGYLNASGDLIVSQGGEMDVILNNVGMSSPGSGYILKVIEKGEVNLVLNQIKETEKELQGNIFADPFSKADVTLKGGSQLIGNINATSLFIDPDSTWSLTRNSVLKHLSHEGNMTFKFHNDTPWNKKTKEDYSKLSLETLSGRGTFWMNTDIAGHQGDFLDVTGEANGQFDVMVTDSGRSPTSEDSLKIIQTGGGTAEFTLANPGKVVEIGTYQYFLVPDKIKRGWSLVPHPPETETPQKLDVNTSFTEKIASERAVSDATVPLEGTQEAPLPGSPDKAPSAREMSSTLHSTASSTEPVTAKTEVSGETVTPHVTQETKPGNPYQSVKKKVNAKSPAVTRPISASTSAILSMATVDPFIYHSETGQIQERISAKRQAPSDWTLWGTVMNERQNISHKAGADYWIEFNGVSVSADRAIRLGNSDTIQGVFFTYSVAKIHFRGKGIGGGRVRSWSVGTYAAYYHDSGFWLDGILKANRFSHEIKGRMNDGRDSKGHFRTLVLGGTVRGGKDMVAGEMTFTPYLSLSGLKTTRSSLLLSNGMKGDISAQRSALGKVGLRAFYQTRIKEVSVTPWIDVGVEREFIKNNRVRINHRDSFDNDLSGITGVYSLGLSANISQTWNVSATAGYKKGKHVESPWNALLGMSLKF